MTKHKRFEIPSLEEVDPSYAALKERQRNLHERQRVLTDDISKLRHVIATDAGPAIRPEVAELLGDTVVDERTENAKRLREMERELGAVEQANKIVQDRVRSASGKASAKVCERIRPEYGRRVRALCEALDKVAEAREHYENLCDGLDAEGVAWTRLGVYKPQFLGDRKDGRIQRLIKEAREAGYA